MTYRLCAALALAVAGCASTPPQPSAETPAATVWQFNELQRIGGAAVRAEGDPQIISADAGPTVRLEETTMPCSWNVSANFPTRFILYTCPSCN